MAKSLVSILFTTDSVELAVKDAFVTTGNTRGFISVGVDGSGNAQFILVDTTGRQVVVGAGVAGTPAGGVLSIQGVAGGTDLPVSVASLPLPTGAATETTLASRLAEATFTARINTLGQKAMAASTPVTFASDQSALPVTDNGGSLTVDGTVTANIGTTNGLALDATLTDGTQKAIVRGGAKGATTAADVTSTAQGADHQGLDVQIYHGGVAKDPTAIRALTNVDIVTAAQGAGAAANAPWSNRLSDGTSFYNTNTAGQLPAALVGGRLDTNIGAWLGSTVPTIGQKTKSTSIPVTFASDQDALAIAGVERATYIAEAALAGANSKDMISIFNPSGSGKIVRVFEVWAAVPSSSGATVIIPFEMRLATAITTGSTVTAAKYDQDDPGAQAVVRSAPTGITDHATTPKMYTWVEQINTAQGSTDAHSHTVHDGSLVDRTKPIILREGQGLYLRQIATNTSTFRMGVYWTEE